MTAGEHFVARYQEYFRAVEESDEKSLLQAPVLLGITHYTSTPQPVLKLGARKYQVCPFFGRAVDHALVYIPIPEVDEHGHITRYVKSKIGFSSYAAFLAYDAYHCCNDDALSIVGTAFRASMDAICFQDVKVLFRDHETPLMEIQQTIGEYIDSVVYGSLWASNNMNSFYQNNWTYEYIDAIEAFIATSRKQYMSAGRKRKKAVDNAPKKRQKTAELSDISTSSARDDQTYRVLTSELLEAEHVGV
jgi:hypothetical protein